MTLRAAKRLGRWLVGRDAPATDPHASATPLAAAPGHCFRVRFRFGRTADLTASVDELVFATEEEHGERVVLRPRDRDAALNDARDVVMRGERYETAEEAEAAAARWVARLQLALARLHLGADFGRRAPRSGLTKYGLAMLEQQVGRRVLYDEHGTVVYVCDPQPAFATLGPITGVVGKPADRLVELVRAAGERDLTLDDREQLAFDLYSASFSEGSADARFLMLMMALETLIEQEPRSEAAAAHVGRLIVDTRASDLPPDEIASLAGSLEELAKRESVGSAGRRLARTLGETEYALGEPPPVFFTRCYEMRSALVHGRYPRPERSEVGSRAAPLESFVGDLLGVDLLDR